RSADEDSLSFSQLPAPLNASYVIHVDDAVRQIVLIERRAYRGAMPGNYPIGFLAAKNDTPDRIDCIQFGAQVVFPDVFSASSQRAASASRTEEIVHLPI